MKKSSLILGLLLFLLGVYITVFSHSPAYAEAGVSINLGEISIDDPLTSGESYSLPSMGVSNSGSTGSNYEMEVIYKDNQLELRPPGAWIEFDPETFYLDAGQSQNVGIVLNIPSNAEPGDYFAYLQVHPISSETGVAIGIAVASKLYFTVEQKPSGFLSSVVDNISDFFKDYSPFSWLGLGIIIIIIISLLLWRFVHISLNIKRR